MAGGHQVLPTGLLLKAQYSEFSSSSRELPAFSQEILTMMDTWEAMLQATLQPAEKAECLENP
jgi:hypothetical protein